MLLVAVSDTHGFHRKLKVPDGDVFIHAGDFMLSGNKEELSLVRDFNDWLGTLPHQHKLITCGNHDRIFETVPQVRSLITNAKLLLSSTMKIEGTRFLMVPWTPQFPEGSDYWKFMLPRREMFQVWEKFDEPVHVLVTHGPPSGILDSVGNLQVGDWHLRRAVFDKLKPRVHIFGHIHEGRGFTEINGTNFYNVTQVNAAYQPIYQSVVIEL